MIWHVFQKKMYGLNFLLIPRFRQDGAAIATVAAEMTVTLMQIIIARKYIPVSAISWKYANYYIGTLIMSAACIGLTALDMNNVLNIIIIPVCGALVYGVWLILRKDRLMTEILKDLKIS